MLKFVLGRSKSGKTEYVKSYLAELARKGEDKLLFLVPDQQTFETEKGMLELLGPTLARSVTVMGFSRLCRHIFSLAGYVPGNLADDSVKSLLMSVALKETSDNLLVYGKEKSTLKLVSRLLSTRHDLMRNKIKAEDLEVSEGYSKTLRNKLHDVSLVLKTFDALMENSFEDPDGELSIAYDLMLGRDFFKGYKVCIDGFLSFSKLEYDIIERLLFESDELLVTLSDDGAAGENSIFSVSRETAAHIKMLAHNNGVKIAPDELCTYSGYFENSELSLLEENAFALMSEEDEKITVSEKPENIRLYCATDIFEEADFVARNIKRLVMEEGYSYKDFAIILRDISHYRATLENTLTSYGISHFTDKPKNVMSSPLMKLVFAVFDCVNNYFDKNSVLAVLKSGLLGVDALKISIFENYVFTWSLNGKSFYNEFTANPRGFADEFSADDLLELSRAESVRKMLMEPLLDFKNSVKDANAREISESLYTLLLKYNVPENIGALSDELNSRGELRLSQEQLRLWEAFVDTLDRTVAVIGDRRVSSEEYSELLALQFMNLDLAYIPRAIDEVTVGDIERLRLSGKKAVFVMGAVEGEFPKVSQSGGLFTNAERHTLTQAGIFSDATVELEYTRERYHCYYALSSASEKLFVSFPVNDNKEQSNRPSEIFTEIRNVFVNIELDSFDSVDNLSRLWAEKPGFSMFARRVGSTDRLTEALSEYYRKSERYAPSVDALARAKNKEPFRLKEKESPSLLYGDNYYLTASRSDTFYRCKFFYYCRYGLRLNERKRAEMDSLEYGTYVHYILEVFLKNHSKEELSSLTRKQVSEELSKIMDTYIESRLGGSKDKSERFLYLFTRVRESLTKLLIHQIDELKQSKFTPDIFELNIGKDIPAYELTLPDGQMITVIGKIDRADIYEQDGKKYIRIIDYKTGPKKFSLSRVLFGLDMQMLLYLSILCRDDSERYGKGLLPAGVLYSPAYVPIIKSESKDPEEIMGEVYKELRLNGLILNDSDVLNAMEENINGTFIPVSLAKGMLKGADSLATLEEFGKIFEKVDEMIGEMAKEIKSGKIEAVPLKGGGEDACRYCPYHSLCRHGDEDPEKTVFTYKRDEINELLGVNSDDGEGEN
ncbi:MAG: PD-(D/E)XK nuclease family protein [Ruminococcus sp.]